MRRVGLAIVLVAGAASAAFAEPGFVPIELRARTIETFEIATPTTPAGTISFRGGLSLSSPNRDFGALSGIEFAPDSRLIAIEDTGFWFTARLVEEGGWLRGIADGQIAPMLDEVGDQGNLRSSTDAEGLRLMPDGRSVLVSFEQDHRLRTFALADLASAPAIDPGLPLPDLSALSSNRGIEAVAVAPSGPLGGSTLIFAESAEDNRGGLRAWVIGGARAGEFAVRRHGQFNITDAAFLPNGDLFILERLFSMADGIGMRIRRLSAEDIRPGAIVDGPVILEEDRLFQIDNMEGMALRELPSGDVLITLVSDNNRSLLQRNLLLQFLWQEAVVPAPLPRPGP